ncbi:MAG: lysophospholipid acyltransferase family protein [Tannerella sp.]|nr:lysophospholipid acyltransferase family protein [Tannerella sp.]
MGNKILYIILHGWVKLHAMLPFPLLYLFSDMLYVLVYRVVRYRLKVVRRNMKASFPEKTETELRQLERDFYHHFADYFMETIKLAHISRSEVQRRAFIVNPELIDDLMKEGHTCILMLLGHYGNWEWITGDTSFFEDTRLYGIYRPLKNKAFDQQFIYLRSRFGQTGIKKADTLRDILKLKQDKTRSVVFFLADQTPSKANLHYWTTFLNQESAILNGPERIARKQKLPVVFSDVKKTARGFYTIELKLITSTPQETPEFWITEQYARLMENSILRNPAYWLWTHKRWKHSLEPRF